MTHAPRLVYGKLAPASFKALLELSSSVYAGPLPRTLVDLVFLRVSQINGCGYCVDLHYRDLAERGESPRRVNAVAGWRESPFFDDKERAALAFAELVTSIPQRDLDDAAYTEVRRHLDEAEMAQLGFAVATMSAWNRLNIAFRTPVAA